MMRLVRPKLPPLVTYFGVMAKRMMPSAISSGSRWGGEVLLVRGVEVLERRRGGEAAARRRVGGAAGAGLEVSTESARR
jgi:hypothetical protein